MLAERTCEVNVSTIEVTERYKIAQEEVDLVSTGVQKAHS